MKKYLNIRAANNALKEAANAAGIQDTKLYKQMQELFGKVTRHDDGPLEIKNLLERIDKLSEKGILKEGDTYVLMPPQMTQELFEKQYKGAKLPENAVAVMIQRADGKKIACRELILNDGIGETITAYPQDKLIVISLD